MQAIQLLHRSVSQMAFPDDEMVVGTMISMLPNDTITGIMASCVRLPIFSFATPKTRFGMWHECTACTRCTCMSCACSRLPRTLPHRKGQRQCFRPVALCRAVGKEDMLLMRGHWQLADMHLCVARVPLLLQASQLAPWRHATALKLSTSRMHPRVLALTLDVHTDM